MTGNHDWGTGNTNSLAGYNGYFGAAATDANGKSYYSYDIPSSNWHVVNLDTECALVRRLQRRLGPGAVARRPTWRRTQQERHRRVAQAALQLGRHDDQELQPLWDDLYAAGVDMLLDGHDHIYERTAPMKSGATLAVPPVADPTYGIRQFTVGTGGEGHHGLTTPLPTSQVRNATTFGVLKLTLHATTYDWEFLPIAGSTFTDSGTGSVHDAPPGNHQPERAHRQHADKRRDRRGPHADPERRRLGHRWRRPDGDVLRPAFRQRQLHPDRRREQRRAPRARTRRRRGRTWGPDSRTSGT